MDRESFIGLVYHLKIQRQMITFNIIRGNGGEVCQMALERIKKSMVTCILAFLKMDLNMVKDLRCMEMEIIIKESL